MIKHSDRHRCELGDRQGDGNAVRQGRRRCHRGPPSPPRRRGEGHSDDRGGGGRAIAVAADVGDEAEVDKVFDRARDAFGTPTLLVNAAGVDAAGIEVAKMELDHFRKVIDTNLIGPFLFCRAFVCSCKSKQARGKIINICSVHEDIPRAGAANYCASKGGLRNLARCPALELPSTASPSTISRRAWC